MIEVKVPLLGGELKQGIVAAWLAEKGDRVCQEDELVEVVTSKINLVIPAPVDGELVEILAPEGTVVTPGDVLGIIDEE